MNCTNCKMLLRYSKKSPYQEGVCIGCEDSVILPKLKGECICCKTLIRQTLFRFCQSGNFCGACCSFADRVVKGLIKRKDADEAIRQMRARNT